MNRFSDCGILPDKEMKESREPVLEGSDVVWTVGESVEVLSQESGVRGCWFRAMILDSSKCCLKVQYCDLNEPNPPFKKTEERIKSDRKANSEYDLGMRFNGRLRVRPWPWPSHEFSDFKFKVGDAVDAWGGQGWWEGIVSGCSSSDKGNLIIFFPGEKMFKIVEEKDLRVSRDWVDKMWKDIKPFPEILSYLSELKIRLPRVLVEANSSAVAAEKICNPPKLKESEANSSAVAAEKICNPPKLKESEDANRNIPCSSRSAGSKAKERSQKKRRVIKKNIDGSCNNSGNAAKGNKVEKPVLVLALACPRKSKEFHR